MNETAQVIEFFNSDGRTGTWLCNKLLVRSDITDEEKKLVLKIQQAIAADKAGFKATQAEYFWLRALWWRDKRDGKPKRLKAEVRETRLMNSYGTKYVSGVVVQCMDCGHEEEVFGTGEASKKRGAIMLRQNCPYNEQNFYSVAVEEKRSA